MINQVGNQPHPPSLLADDRLGGTVDSGDYVAVTNCRNIKVSGQKAKQLVYRKHSMYPSGLKEIPYERMMETKPWEIVRHAVSGMLPKNKLRERRLERLKIFCGPYAGRYEGNIIKRWEDGSLKGPSRKQAEEWEKGVLPEYKRQEKARGAKGGKALAW